MVRPAQRQEASWAPPVLLFPWKAVVSAGEGHRAHAHPRKVSPAAAPGALSLLEKLLRELLPGGTGLERGRRRGGSAAGGAGGEEGVTPRHWERSCSQGGQLGAEREPGSSGQMAELGAEAREKEGNYSQREGGRGRA